MRIVHVNTERTWRGGESQVFNLMTGLRALGHDVELIGLPGGALAGRCRESGIPVTEMTMRSDADVLAGARIAAHLGRRGCDVLHAQTARAHSLALLARAARAARRLVVSRRIDFPVRRDPANRWKYRTRLVDRYIAVAGVIRDVLVAAGVPAARIEVIHSSIDLSRFSGSGDGRPTARAELGIPAGAPVVGHVAALAWHKGQKDLVSAIPALAAAEPDVRVVLVGSGEEEQALKRQAAELGVEARVIFTGARSDVPRLLPAFDVFCMPSYLEGTCNAVLEAFAMRVPVVASSAGGLPELVEPERTGLLVPPRDPVALSAALLRMLRERELARRCAEAAFARVHERYGVDRMVSRTAALYQEVMTA